MLVHKQKLLTQSRQRQHACTRMSHTAHNKVITRIAQQYCQGSMHALPVAYTVPVAYMLPTMMLYSAVYNFSIRPHPLTSFDPTPQHVPPNKHSPSQRPTHTPSQGLPVWPAGRLAAAHGTARPWPDAGNP